MPQGAAAALGKVRTVGALAGRGGSAHFLHPAPGGAPAYFEQPDQALLPPEGAFDKHRHAIQPGDAIPVAGVALDGEGDKLIFSGADHN